VVNPGGFSGVVYCDKRWLRRPCGTVIVGVGTVQVAVCTPLGHGQGTVPGIVRIKERIDGPQGCESVFGVRVAVITGSRGGGPVGTPDSTVTCVGGMF